MNARRIFHLSGNVFPALPQGHPTLRIWQELARAADEYHVFASAGALRYSHSQTGKLHLHLLPSIGARMWSFFFTSWLVVAFAARMRPSHVVAQCPVYGGLAGLACARLFGAALLTEIHGEYYFRRMGTAVADRLRWRLFRSVSRLTFRGSHRIRSLSESMTKQLGDVYGEGIARKTVIVTNRVDLATFSPPKTSYVVEGPLNVITVGSYSSRKNHLALLRDLFACDDSARLTIVGRGALAPDYLDLAATLGASDRVRLVHAPSHAALAELLRAHDVYLHYALSEALPRSVLEAMAMGLPVVCVPVGFIEGTVVHGRDALLLGRQGARDLAQALGALKRSETLRGRLGRAARATIVEHHEWNRAFATYRAAIIGCATTPVVA